jgi:hypothetical protein
MTSEWINKLVKNKLINYRMHELIITWINKKFCEELIACFPWYDTGHIENDAPNTSSSIVACVFVIAVTFLPSRSPATIRRYLLSRCLATIRKFLPSRCLATIGELLSSLCLGTMRGYLHNRCLATIGGMHRHTHSQTATWSHKPTLFPSK